MAQQVNTITLDSSVSFSLLFSRSDPVYLIHAWLELIFLRFQLFLYLILLGLCFALLQLLHWTIRNVFTFLLQSKKKNFKKKSILMCKSSKFFVFATKEESRTLLITLLKLYFYQTASFLQQSQRGLFSLLSSMEAMFCIILIQFLS